LPQAVGATYWENLGDALGVDPCLPLDHPVLGAPLRARLDERRAADPARECALETVNSTTKLLYLSLFIKKRNAQKHHSHRWFFEGWGALNLLRTGPRLQYYFATDVGTLYAPRMLVELVRHMDDEKNEHCAACCAHQVSTSSWGGRTVGAAHWLLMRDTLSNLPHAPAPTRVSLMRSAS
jgi:hypothetical protein